MGVLVKPEVNILLFVVFGFPGEGSVGLWRLAGPEWLGGKMKFGCC